MVIETNECLPVTCSMATQHELLFLVVPVVLIFFIMAFDHMQLFPPPPPPTPPPPPDPVFFIFIFLTLFAYYSDFSGCTIDY